ncbi:hypothetical protein L226DRAFT_535900 [Lentinus tigrinus ALCF2SS1-7]|uniref:MYND-type domain-containing protein n=1 Tax=Lentinus tigrinus ALCF2SS1-6 TaxID=1328759 RepID=A0A5C2RYJ3_9APHY|nr:hypothetical protein L227DRAFT_579090 [Lentinus tigrinus ALCF2SS1-6]RPD74009.1 hypothetical protein L226DRAFT_535900 [Lentinus tigrinus ALCF2SS1-7]
MLLLSISTLAGAMVVLTLAAIFLPDPPCPLEEDRCGFAFCEVCMKEAPYACSACKTTRYCSTRCQGADWRNHQRSCKIHQKLNDLNNRIALTPPKRPPVGQCTGCNVRAGEGGRLAMCKDCGYQVCGSCESHHSRGTCYCPNSNFGKKYCQMEPRWYHTNGRGRPYSGDRHPDAFVGVYAANIYEQLPRTCDNCGDVTKVFKKEYRDPWLWH